MARCSVRRVPHRPHAAEGPGVYAYVIVLPACQHLRKLTIASRWATLIDAELRSNGNASETHRCLLEAMLNLGC
jgi:hypothetical protein